MKNIIIIMLIVLGFSTLFVDDDEQSFYSWFSWAGLFVAISLLAFYIMGVF